MTLDDEVAVLFQRYVDRVGGDVPSKQEEAEVYQAKFVEWIKKEHASVWQRALPLINEDYDPFLDAFEDYVNADSADDAESSMDATDDPRYGPVAGALREYLSEQNIQMPEQIKSRCRIEHGFKRWLFRKKSLVAGSVGRDTHIIAWAIAAYNKN